MDLPWFLIIGTVVSCLAYLLGWRNGERDARGDWETMVVAISNTSKRIFVRSGRDVYTVGSEQMQLRTPETPPEMPNDDDEDTDDDEETPEDEEPIMGFRSPGEMG